MAQSEVKYCKIFPGIGIARVGDSPDEYFIGAEAPGLGPEAGAGFKDGKGRIKRQAARFRIYGFDADDRPVREVSLHTPGTKIAWTVRLANRKASAHRFNGVEDGKKNDGHPDPKALRNLGVADRASLEIVPDKRTISGANLGGAQYALDDGCFAGKAVYLGELKTDGAGRLLVLGGRGLSGHVPDADPLTTYANNDGWHDDTSDGCVTAEVTVDGVSLEVRQASWVIVAPPKFAPYVRNVVPLYDVMAEAKAGPAPDAVSFTRHIYPHLAAFSDQQWVNARALRGHGPTKGGLFTDPAVLLKLSDNGPASKALRQSVLRRLRDGTAGEAQANYDYMPQLAGDEGDCAVGLPATWLSVPRSTYDVFSRWADGQFESDWPGTAPEPPRFGEIAIAEQPAALDRAALEWCAGGPFFPGIEITYIARDPGLYSEPFRFDAGKIEPGDITKRMAVPWQADFYECAVHWWPAQRPDDVLNHQVFEKLCEDFPAEVRDGRLAGVTSDRLAWDRGVGDRWQAPDIADPTLAARVARAAGDNDMVDKWRSLGFVVPVRTDAGEVLQVEVGRSRYDGLGDRDYFYYMLNIDSYPDFIPRAKQIARDTLAEAERKMLDPTPGAIDDLYRFFPYSKEAFDQRMDEIYNFYQADIDVDPSLDPDTPFNSREDMIERLRQFAPLNQLDGVWVRNVGKVGPIDDISALLFNVWMDEVGDGDPEQNHSRVYTNLLESIGIVLPPVNSRDYAYNPDMLDSAYTVPLFEMAISQFTETFFPEILGMTMQFEWEVLATWPTVRQLRHFKIDPHFYELHIGIDNAANGHGAKAREAVSRFVDQARERGGDAEAQAVWRRIWTGYAAFATTGNLGNDLRDLLERRHRNPVTAADKVTAIMLQKKKYGSLNHNHKTAGGQLINDLFEDPDAFQKALVASGYIVPGHPELSPFFEKVSFTGPMYKVFTDEEIKVWEEWTFSLAQQPSPAPKPEPVVADPAILMRELVDDLRSAAVGVPTHQHTDLVGPDPSDPGKTVTMSLADWIRQPSATFMAVFSDPKNKLVVPGHADQSAFMTDVLSVQNDMWQAFQSVPGDSGGKSWQSIVAGWIDAGCPLPEAAGMAPRLAVAGGAGLAATAAVGGAPPHGDATGNGAWAAARAAAPRATPAPASPAARPRRRLVLTDPARVVEAHPRGKLQGMGCVH